jgi:hypothetical protein
MQNRKTKLMCRLQLSGVFNFAILISGLGGSGSEMNVNGNARATSNATFPQDIEELTSWRDRYAPNMPIWMTETGYDSAGPFGTSESIQAARLQRSMLIRFFPFVTTIFSKVINPYSSAVTWPVCILELSLRDVLLHWNFWPG